MSTRPDCIKLEVLFKIIRCGMIFHDEKYTHCKKLALLSALPKSTVQSIIRMTYMTSNFHFASDRNDIETHMSEH